jgi:hypothetical protein
MNPTPGKNEIKSNDWSVHLNSTAVLSINHVAPKNQTHQTDPESKNKTTTQTINFSRIRLCRKDEGQGDDD